MLTQFDIGWLVGLIEGDGCFTFDGKVAVIALKMTDLDTVQRFASMLGATVMGPYCYEDSQMGTKPCWVSRLTGRRAKEFMASTMHHFSSRRQQQIRALIGGQLTFDGLQHESADEFDIEFDIQIRCPEQLELS